MKSLVLALAVVLVANTAQAQQARWTREQVVQHAPQARHWTEAQWQEFNRAASCAWRNTLRLRKAGDPHAVRLAREQQRFGGDALATVRGLENTRDFQRLQRSHRRVCG
jgi:hypothetical protein